LNIKKSPFFFLTLCVLLQNSLGFCYDDRPRCFRALEVNYFDQVYLYQALNFFNLPQGSWNLVLTALHQQSARVPSMMMIEGKKLPINPLENPFDPVGAEKLLMKVLYSIFYEALHNNVVIDDPSITKMFNYIRRHKQPAIDACFREAEAKRNLRRPIENTQNK